MKIFRICAILVFLFCSCHQVRVDKSTDVITYSNIEKHIRELSDDKYMGRMPMTSSEPAVIAYISGQMKEIGLEGANNGSYFQQVPVLKVTSRISPVLRFTTPSGLLEFHKLTDYVSFTRKMKEEVSLDNCDVVFAGFGINAPEYHRNDFAGLDVKGKMIIVFVNDPGYGTNGSYFKGNTMTYYGRWTYKFEEAARQGATACLIIHETGPAGYGWNVVSNNGETTKLYLQPDDGYQHRCSLEGWISLSSAQKLFAACRLNLDSLKRNAVAPGFRPLLLPVKASAWIKNGFKTGTSNNVCGVIKGKTHPDEAIVYTAHWDHLGVGTAVNGDSIYNGATDNASAVSWLLEIARAFRNGPQPERSVLFLSPTGEESGLLGSEYYCEHPFFESKKTVACINTDVILFLGKFNDVTITGYGQSELDKWIEKCATTQNRYIVADPNPENGMYFRSDHFPFAKKGIPALFAKGYTDAAGCGKEKTREFITGYWGKVYHTPQDEYVPGRDDLTGLVNDARLFYLVGRDLANSTAWPAWEDGSEFKKARNR
jgi:Zn-dependent M28 family amino/carboxypeptidase